MTRRFEVTELARFQDAVAQPRLIADRDLTDFCGLQADLLDDGRWDEEDHELLTEVAELEAQQVDDTDVPF